MSNENIKYYASLVSFYTIFNLKRMSREIIHAYLLCFISYRYQTVNDNLVNTFLHHVNKFIDEAKKAAKEQMAQEGLEANKHLTLISRTATIFFSLFLLDLAVEIAGSGSGLIGKHGHEEN
jgi:hypothetical protein